MYQFGFVAYANKAAFLKALSARRKLLKKHAQSEAREARERRMIRAKRNAEWRSISDRMRSEA